MSNKQNKVVRLTEDILNTPQLITAQAFEVIRSYLEGRNTGTLMKLDPVDADDPDEDDLNYDPMIGVGVLDISGSLTNKPVYTICGAIGTSYLQLIEQAEEMIEAGCDTIIMNIASGGGEAFNCFAAANELRDMCDENEVELIAYVQNLAASGAYAWAVVADEVISHPQGEIGSVGVLIALRNYSKQLEMEGIQQVFVTAGKNKIPFDANGAFTKTFLDDLQNKAAALYTQFVDHIANYTGLSTDVIQATEASTYLAPQALEMGLINAIMTNEEFEEYIANKRTGTKAENEAT